MVFTPDSATRGSNDSHMITSWHFMHWMQYLNRMSRNGSAWTPEETITSFKLISRSTNDILDMRSDRSLVNLNSTIWSRFLFHRQWQFWKRVQMRSKCTITICRTTTINIIFYKIIGPADRQFFLIILKTVLLARSMIFYVCLKWFPLIFPVSQGLISCCLMVELYTVKNFTDRGYRYE